MDTGYEIFSTQTTAIADMKNLNIELKRKTNNSYDKITGIHLRVAFANSALTEVDVDGEVVRVKLSDRTDSNIIPDIPASMLSSSNNLVTRDRFLPVSLDAQNNELTFNFSGIAEVKKYDGRLVFITVTVRYE